MDEIKYEQQKLYIYLTEPNKGMKRKIFNSVSDIKNYDNSNKSDNKIPVMIVIYRENSLDELREYIKDITNTHFVPNTIDGIKETIDVILYNNTFIETDNNILIKHYDKSIISDAELIDLLDNIYIDAVNIVGLYIEDLNLFNSQYSYSLPTQMALNRNKLKEIAGKLNIPIISTQQINRSAIVRSNHHNINAIDMSLDELRVMVF